MSGFISLINFKNVKRAAVVLGVYALIGFFILPWIAERQLLQFTEQRLSLPSKVESIYFNPFTFYLEINDLDVASENGEPLITLDRLAVNYQLSRLFLFKYQFAAILVDGLDIYFERSSETANTITDLLEQWNATATPAEQPEVAEEAASELPPLEVISLQLANLILHVRDRVPATVYETTLGLSRAEIDNFSTLSGQRAANNVLLQFEEGATLNWMGGFSVDPLDFNGNVALENLSLTTAARYLQDSLPLTVDEGRITLEFDYEITFEDESAAIDLRNISAGLTDLRIYEDIVRVPLLLTSALRLAGGQISIPQNQVEFESASIEGIDLSLVRESDGQLNLQRLLGEVQVADDNAVATNASSVEDSAALPWQFSLQQFTLANNQIRFLDETLAEPFSAVTYFELDISNLTTEDSAEMPFSGSLGLDSGGRLALEGSLQALPQIDVSAELELVDLELVPVQPYLSEYAFIELERGSIGFSSELTSNNQETFGFSGAIAIEDLLLSDEQLNETLFSLESLAIDDLDYSLSDNSLELSEVSLAQFFARVIVNEDGTTNIGRSIKTAEADSQIPEQTVEVEATNTNNTMVVSVGRVTLDNASANFTDRNLPLVFNTNIQELNGTAEGFASNSAQPTTIDLEGRVDEFGLAQIQASLLPFNFVENSEINLAFTNIDMPAMTPYVIKFAGREIDDGDVNVSLSYQLQGGELIANNQLVLSELLLGERVEHPDAMNLPLDLAIALLKDGNGVIDFEVPVTGNVYDPEFNFGPAIRTAISNILGNIVAAPFRFLGGLLGGGGEAELDRVRFLPGRADIAAPEQEVLQNLSAALQQRPQLALQVPALSGEADIAALQEMSVNAQIETGLVATDATELSLIERQKAVLEQLYLQLASNKREQTLEQIQSLHNSLAIPEGSPDTQSAAQTDSGASQVQPLASFELDMLAYNADIRARLIEAEEIDESQLLSLAELRQQAIADFMLGTGAVSEQNLDLVGLPEEVEFEDGWLIMQFDLVPLN